MGGLFGGGDSGGDAVAAESAAKAERDKIEAERNLEKEKADRAALGAKREQANRELRSRDVRRSLLAGFSEEEDQGILSRKTVEGG